MKVVSFHRSALSRQTAEAVRIRRRGGEGAVLNSKAEFNRCYLPRLRLVDEQESMQMEQAEEQDTIEMMEELLKEENNWALKKTKARSSKGSLQQGGSRNERRKKAREQGGVDRPSKRRKFDLIEAGWGTKNNKYSAWRVEEQQ